MQKYKEIEKLLEFQLDIIRNGKIKDDGSGFFTSSEDKERVKYLETL